MTKRSCCSLFIPLGRPFASFRSTSPTWIWTMSVWKRNVFSLIGRRSLHLHSALTIIRCTFLKTERKRYRVWSCLRSRPWRKLSWLVLVSLKASTSDIFTCLVLYHHNLNIHFLPRLILGMDGCFPTAHGRQPTVSGSSSSSSSFIFKTSIFPR